jgi:hypothetical protein
MTQKIVLINGRLVAPAGEFEQQNGAGLPVTRVAAQN